MGTDFAGLGSAGAIYLGDPSVYIVVFALVAVGAAAVRGFNEPVLICSCSRSLSLPLSYLCRHHFGVYMCVYAGVYRRGERAQYRTHSGQPVSRYSSLAITEALARSLALSLAPLLIRSGCLLNLPHLGSVRPRLMSRLSILCGL